MVRSSKEDPIKERFSVEEPPTPLLSLKGRRFGTLRRRLAFSLSMLSSTTPYPFTYTSPGDLLSSSYGRRRSSTSCCFCAYLSSIKLWVTLKIATNTRNGRNFLFTCHISKLVRWLLVSHESVRNPTFLSYNNVFCAANRDPFLEVSEQEPVNKPKPVDWSR